MDAMKVIVGHRQAGQLADAAALAGAREFADVGEEGWDGSGLRLNPTAANDAVADYVTEALRADVAPLLSTVEVTSTVSNSDAGDSVEVTISYEIDDLIFIALASANGEASTMTGERTRSASVCYPSLGRGAAGVCSRPRG